MQFTRTNWADASEPTREVEVFTTADLVAWVTNADEEHDAGADGGCGTAENSASDDQTDVDEADDCGSGKPPERQLGIRGSELFDLAASAGDKECLSLLRRWRAREWSALPPPPQGLAAASLEEIDDDDREDDDCDEQDDGDDQSPCPHCGSMDDCKHHLVTFGTIDGEAMGGLLCEQIEDVSDRLKQIVRGSGRLAVGASEIFSFRHLRDLVQAAIDEGDDDRSEDGDGIADLQSCQAEVIIELLRENSLVETFEYTIDEASGTWPYVTAYALDPDGVIAWLMATLRDAASDAKT